MQTHTYDRLWLIDKPLHWSSFDVVSKFRNILRKKSGNKKLKVGHAGTLDPLASGLLLVASGKMTKSINTYMDLTKEYVASICLGATTPTLDSETFPQSFEDTKSVSRSLIDTIIDKYFTGKVLQTPPVFSAIKINGRRAYDLARNSSEEVVIPKREINIDSFIIEQVQILTPNQIFQQYYLPYISFLNFQKYQTSYNQTIDSETISRISSILTFQTVLTVRIVCSKGTYIRSLARDLGEALGTQGYLLALRRTKIGNYNMNNAIQITDFDSI